MEQPFYIGQKVVAIKDHSQGRFKTGDKFTVVNVVKGCCIWEVDVGIKIPSMNICTYCERRHDPGVGWYSYIMFAPLQEGFEAITFERVIEEEKVSVN